MTSNGLTPAGAGNTPVRGRPGLRGRAHPRGCGEHNSLGRLYKSGLGSPPRVRGTLVPEALDLVVLGLTPAGAGNTTSPSPPRASPRAHPRGCGEHWASASGIVYAMGSPPRVRGTPLPGAHAPGDVGLTPAGAGNTWRRPPRSPSPRAHPRGCGEHRCDDGGDALEIGLTPAGAGNTTSWTSRSLSRRAHPRGCGEHVEAAVALFEYRGSPPRVRGTLQEIRPRLGLQGLTPAGAGNTPMTASTAPPGRAHPRGCGEHR